MDKLLNFTRALHTMMVKLRTDEHFKGQFFRLIDLVKSPFVQQAIGGSVDIKMVEDIATRIATDETINDVIRVVYNILECFSIDRFVPVESEEALEKKAFELYQKKLFYAAVYFNTTSDKDIVYKFRMDIDNTPITAETRNRFWFPGPESNFELEMRYHRGFVQMKHAIDVGIIKAKKKAQILSEPEIEEGASTQGDDNWFFGNDETDDDFNFDDDDAGENTTTPSSDTSMESGVTTVSEHETNNETSASDKSNLHLAEVTEGTIDPSGNEKKERRKRQLGAGGFFDLLLGIDSKKSVPDKFDVDDVVVHTKQFPYPEYTRDEYVKDSII